MPKRPKANKSTEKLNKKQFAKFLSDISDGQYHAYEFLDFFKILEAGLFQLVKENKEAEIAGLCTFYTKDNPSKEWTDPFTGRAIVTEGSSTLGVKVSQYFQLDTKEAVKLNRKSND
jgi:nucleoid DNA-binding protein